LCRGTLLETLSGHSNGVTTLALLNDDQLISGGFDRTVRRYDIPAIESAVTIKVRE
jgi:WD40 repeat protein